MIIGFTGTHIRITDAQKEELCKILDACNPTELHHGCCICADEYAHNIAQILDGCKIVIHPPVDKKAVFEPVDPWNTDTLPERPYLVRNHDIVDTCDLLIALPFEQKEVLRSGVWATIRYARKLGKKHLIIYPNGDITDE